jgi:hypothetical protein
MQVKPFSIPEPFSLDDCGKVYQVSVATPPPATTVMPLVLGIAQVAHNTDLPGGDIGSADLPSAAGNSQNQILAFTH